MNSIGDIPEAETERFVELSKQAVVAKGAYFIRERYRTDKLGFVEKGLFRSLYLTEDSEECTFSFSPENTFIYECQAMPYFMGTETPKGIWMVVAEVLL